MTSIYVVQSSETEHRLAGQICRIHSNTPSLTGLGVRVIDWVRRVDPALLTDGLAQEFLSRTVQSPPVTADWTPFNDPKVVLVHLLPEDRLLLVHDQEIVDVDWQLSGFRQSGEHWLRSMAFCIHRKSDTMSANARTTPELAERARELVEVAWQIELLLTNAGTGEVSVIRQRLADAVENVQLLQEKLQAFQRVLFGLRREQHREWVRAQGWHKGDAYKAMFGQTAGQVAVEASDRRLALIDASLREIRQEALTLEQAIYRMDLSAGCFIDELAS